MSTPTIANAAGAGVVPGGTPVAANGQRSPLVVNVANFLRDNKLLKNRTGLLNNQDDMEFFRIKRFTRALTSDQYKAKSANARNELLPVATEDEARQMLIRLLEARLVIPVEKLHYDQIKEVKGWKPNRLKPTLRQTQKTALGPDEYFAWVYNKPNPYMVLYGFLAIAAVFAVILFPLWPPFMRLGVWYLSMGCLILLGLFFAMAIVRLIIFLLTYVALPQAFWLYPNLFEDCGFFESFQPAYAWTEPAGSKKKKKRSKKAADSSEPAAETEKATGSEKATTTAVKRKVTLEEVEE